MFTAHRDRVSQRNQEVTTEVAWQLPSMTLRATRKNTRLRLRAERMGSLVEHGGPHKDQRIRTQPDSSCVAGSRVDLDGVRRASARHRSIAGIWSGRLDSNQRPLRPERSALPSCATPRPQIHNVPQQYASVWLDLPAARTDRRDPGPELLSGTGAADDWIGGTGVR